MHSAGQVVDFTLRLDVSDTEMLELLRGKKSRVARSGQNAKTSISARYLSEQDTVTLSSLLHRRFPVNFKLKYGSKSYTNFLKLLARELSELDSATTRGLDESSLESIGDLRDHLQQLLEEADEEQSQDSKQDTRTETEVIDLYRADFELLQEVESTELLPSLRSSSQSGLRIQDKDTGQQLLRTALSERSQKFRFFGDNEPLLISGFVENETEAPRTVQFLQPMFDDWRSVVMFHPELQIALLPGEIKLSGKVAIPERLRSTLELFVHWGPSHAETWRDEEIAPFEFRQIEGDWLAFEKRLRPEQLGRHGVTLCAQVIGTTQRLWLADLGISQAAFHVSASTLYAGTKRVRERRVYEANVQSKLLRSMTSFTRFVRTVDQLARSGKERRLPKMLLEVSREDVELRTLLDSFSLKVEQELAAPTRGHSRAMLKRVQQVLRLIGIGEVVFISPEGPHAIAGGLAQVIVGLTKALNREGVPTTIIAPLYENAQGSKHQSAEDVISQGVVLADQRVPVELVGEIKILFGATRIAGTLKQQQFARVVPVQVYKAERGLVRLFLLRHHSLADSLYSYSSGENALRKAVFLSRGALELLRSRHFDVVPDTIISNDWVTALVPVYLRCDPRYSQFGVFESARTVHMLHNAGPVFQGRFFVNEFGQDLWPIVSLADEHFFWLSDPNSQNHLNLTAGAIRHVSGALLTVSQPYAEQLLKPEVGGALAPLLKKRRELLFGISNGVDTEALRYLYRDLGEEARRDAEKPPIIRGKQIREETIVKKLPEIKDSLKAACQQRYGLSVRPDAVLLAMVGRLTSQKGVQLLTGDLRSNGKPLLQQLLERNADVQVLIAGPLCIEEAEVREFHARYERLVLQFPGRVASSFDFLPHRQALAITCASDVFLMPSMYEPGGITQLEALAAGTSVVGHDVGGIAATLAPFDPRTSEGDSFLFRHFSTDACYFAIEQSVQCLKDSSTRAVVRTAALRAAHDWKDRVRKYLALFHSTNGLFLDGSDYAYLSEYRRDLSDIRPLG